MTKAWISLRLAAALCLASLTAGCETTSSVAGSPTDADKPFPIFTASDALEERWHKVQVWSVSEWRLAIVDERIVLAPEVDKSSTALGRWIEFDTLTCPVVEWTWRVEALPKTAVLASREAEDVAASVIFVFGDPGSLHNPEPVPTLRYVWSAEADAPETVVDSPYFPGVIRNFVLRSGEPGATWETERRNIREDYIAAFGGPPEEPVKAFALYSDNDHNGEPVTAYYSDARALCSELPETDSIL